ncbi:MAG TPA: alpha/beta hydrolase [Longimicrobiales bacterium]
MTTCSLAILGVATLLCLTAADPGAAQDRRLAHLVPGMDQVRRIDNLSYRDLTGSPDTVMYGPALMYDVFMPPDGDDVRPGVIFIHGGLVAGSTQRVSPKDALPAYAQWGRLVAASGLVGITFSHRLNTNENVDTAASDVLRLLAEVRQRAAEWRLDPDRICVAVFSAGGPLASLFMTDGPSAAPSVRCIAFYYAFLDMEHAAVISPFRPAHTEPRLSQLRAYSPLAALLRNTRPLPPLLVARAGRDAIPGINASIDRFTQSSLLTNQTVELYNHPGGRHGFDLTAEPDARAEYILAATLRFFQRHLSG